MGLFEQDVGYGRGNGKAHLTLTGRAVTVISPAQVTAALSAAATTGHPIILLSAPFAADYVGPAWFAKLVATAAKDFPDAMATPVLDCGDAPGFALAALRIGITAICFDGPTAARIRDIAEQYGATVLAERPKSLDLQALDIGRADLVAACTAWLNAPS